MKSILIAIFAAAALVACGKKEETPVAPATPAPAPAAAPAEATPAPATTASEPAKLDENKK